ncbi:MAG: sensor histidine kinase [Thermoanaerobaculia bacterium]
MPDKSKANILLVDDQPNNLLALEAMLEDLGQNLVRADSGTAALRALLEQEFAAILLDVQMPGLDGFETARLIRQRERSRHTPIIFITALSRSETNVFKGYSIGAVDYLFNPIVPEVLRSKVGFFVELWKKNQELKLQAAQLQRLNRQTELILRYAADAVFGLDLDANVTFANRAAVQMLGIPANDMIGKEAHLLLHPVRTRERREGECPLFAAVHGEMRADLHEDFFWKADGTAFPAEYIVSRMDDEDGSSVGYVLTFRDVSERHAAALARENERLYREAQAANRAKDDFLATLSHELRTPMTAILGWLEMLGYDDIDPELMREGLATIRSSARLQAQLIDDMLDVSRIVMGKFLIEQKPTRLSVVVQGALETVRPVAKEKQLTLRSDFKTADDEVMGDPVRLNQVFWNLLSNAVKFTEPGGDIAVDLTRENGLVVVTVRDSGMGIPHDIVPHIFNRLEQGSEARKYGGLGLGLAIARHIVEGHGGAITARSDGEGQGATFSVSLPAASVEERSQASGVAQP